MAERRTAAPKRRMRGSHLASRSSADRTFALTERNSACMDALHISDEGWLLDLCEVGNSASMQYHADNLWLVKEPDWLQQNSCLFLLAAHMWR